MRIGVAQRPQLVIPPRVRLEEQDEVGIDVIDQREERGRLPVVDEDVCNQEVDSRVGGTIRCGFCLGSRQRRVGPDVEDLPGERRSKQGRKDELQATPWERHEREQKQHDRKTGRYLYPWKIPNSDPALVARDQRQNGDGDRRHTKRDQKPAYHPNHCSLAVTATRSRAAT
jgi:hypothetical protein